MVNIIEGLKSLGGYMDLEAAEEKDAFCSTQRAIKQINEGLNVTYAALPNGRKIALLKTMLSTYCEKNCNYCAFRSGRDFRRCAFTPDQMARAFMAVYQAGIVQGLFLSSGVIAGGPKTQDYLIATIELLRNKHQFHGYIHLKLMPGVEQAQVERSMQIANRVSLNLEAPNSLRLQVLAPRKNFQVELMRPLTQAQDIRKNQSPGETWNGRWPSLATQFVIGAVGENDIELLKTSEYLFNQIGLTRIYYSAFKPVSDTPLEKVDTPLLAREFRLYQASYLIRDYGFEMDEFLFDLAGNLPLESDPKRLWAERYLSEAPVEVNHASRRDLLRIPGIGPRSVDYILAARKNGKLQKLEDLKKIGVNPLLPSRYILLDGRRPSRQLPLFSEYV